MFALELDSVWLYSHLKWHEIDNYVSVSGRSSFVIWIWRWSESSYISCTKTLPVPSDVCNFKVCTHYYIGAYISSKFLLMLLLLHMLVFSIKKFLTYFFLLDFYISLPIFVPHPKVSIWTSLVMLMLQFWCWKAEEAYFTQSLHPDFAWGGRHKGWCYPQKCSAILCKYTPSIEFSDLVVCHFFNTDTLRFLGPSWYFVIG